MARFRHYVLLWARCWPVRRGAPGAGGAPGPRSGVIPPLPRAGVREHHAPVGALRPMETPVGLGGLPGVREHHAPVGALRLDHDGFPFGWVSVREHHAPVGALRHHPCLERDPYRQHVREHHAPVGALRHVEIDLDADPGSGQGAPRTCRCIETRPSAGKLSGKWFVREHHAPVGALRPPGRRQQR